METNHVRFAVDPRTATIFLLTCIVLAFSGKSIPFLAIVSLGLLFLAVVQGQPLDLFAKATLLMVLVLIQLIIIQLIFCREGNLVGQWGVLRIYDQAIPFAVIGFLRGLIMVFAGLHFYFSTTPGGLNLMLLKTGLPYRYAMLAGLSLRFLPVMASEFLSIMASQRARGVALYTVREKIKGVFPIALPLLYRSLRRATDTALAMEMRGFGKGKERTFLDELHMKGWEKGAIALMAVAMVAAVLLRFLPLGS